MQLSLVAQKIAPLVEPAMNAMGYDLIRIHWQDGARAVLQIMAERKDGQDITVEDCTEISHTISAILDVEDPIGGAYHLEVSSPGMDRPLVKPDDFVNYSGYEVKIEMQVPQQGRKRFKGSLLGINEQQQVLLRNQEGEYLLPYSEMYSAKLVLTDELIKQSLKAREQHKNKNSNNH